MQVQVLAAAVWGFDHLGWILVDTRHCSSYFGVVKFIVIYSSTIILLGFGGEGCKKKVDITTDNKMSFSNKQKGLLPYLYTKRRDPTVSDNMEEERANTSLFPLNVNTSETSSQTNPNASQWLSNTSFTTDLSLVNNVVPSLYDALNNTDDDEEEPTSSRPSPLNPPHEFLEDSPESDADVAVAGAKLENKARKKKRRRHRNDAGGDHGDHYGSSRKKSWPARSSVSSSSKPGKEYYFDSGGDRDNLAFGCLYRMDLARYKLVNSAKTSGLELQTLYGRVQQRKSIFDRDDDIDKLDDRLKSSGRYWSAKYSALERHKNLKHVHFLMPKKSSTTIPNSDVVGDFTPLSTCTESSHEGIDGQSVVEESWEDEVSRKTREHNKMTREHPHDVKSWLAFAEFQDRVASMQPQKGARLQTLEKKISILEKATELNQENEELLIHLLRTYQNRDSSDILIGRWEKVLMHHSGSYQLWKEFLRVVQGDFSRFKVSEIRKIYTHAIQALYSACSKQHRQLATADTACHDQDPRIVLLELNLIDVFVSLCRFEWQAGYQEVATACFQAEIEYSLFSPSLYLTETSKQRLFEHFWNSNAARIGEEEAFGWSTWLAKEEESKQNLLHQENEEEVSGGWTGWSEPPLLKPKEVKEELENEQLDDKTEDDDSEEALLKMLGIDINAEEGDLEVTDTSAWTRWSEEESSRDCEQWMPLHANFADSHPDASPGRDVDEQLTRVILFDDVSKFLFSLSSTEARLSLILQFIDFFGGNISQWICTNNSNWTEKLLSLETLPDSILEYLGTVRDILSKSENNFEVFELVLGGSSDISKKTSMMKFIRNAILLCLTVFPRNHILEEVVLVAEDMSITKMNTSRVTITPCRPLAKCLLKFDRQDVLLCGVYAQREAVFGNIDYARKIFDMALSSVEGLSLDIQSNAALLYFWYAEVEVANSCGNSSEPSIRAMHILSCLGSGVRYSPFKCKPSSLQLLKAHQGYKERIQTVRSGWTRGPIQDTCIALICSAARFEELTTGGSAGLQVLDQVFSIVLPERKRQSYHLEYLFNYYVTMLLKHFKESRQVMEVISYGLQIYPFSPKLFCNLVEISHLYSVPNKLRCIFDDFSHKNPCVIVWIFALSYEISKQGWSQHRVHALFERALANEQLHTCVLIWRCYIAFEVDVVRNLSAARRIFFRAIHACPWSKKLWLDGFHKLSSILTAKEVTDLQEVMREKELNLRTDIYEILLQDQSKP